jgi:hypothetical protein
MARSRIATDGRGRPVRYEKVGSNDTERPKAKPAYLTRAALRLMKPAVRRTLTRVLRRAIRRDCDELRRQGEAVTQDTPGRSGTAREAPSSAAYQEVQPVAHSPLSEESRERQTVEPPAAMPAASSATEPEPVGQPSETAASDTELDRMADDGCPHAEPVKMVEVGLGQYVNERSAHALGLVKGNSHGFA